MDNVKWTMDNGDMPGILFPLITICELAILGWGLRLRSPRHLARILLLLFIASLVFGNAVMSLGSWIEEGPLLENLHRSRLVIRALCFPLLIYITYDLVKRTGLEWSQAPGLNLAVWAVVFILIVAQCGSAVIQRPIAPATFSGIVYYREAGFSELQFPVILILAFIITFCLVLFRRLGSPWLALGAIVMFLGAAAPTSLVGPLVNAVTEMAFVVSLLWTEGTQTRNR